jgi:predicted metal-binding membrane protein
LLDKSQKIIGISLVTISIITWVFSIDQPDMMNAMMTLNPVAVTIFTISWTVGMAAMMFPAIIPMVLLYNRFSKSKTDDNNHVLSSRKLNQDADRLERKEDEQRQKSSYLLVSHRVIKTSGFVGTYLLVWSLTGVLLLLFWSVLVNNLFVGYNPRDFAVVSGILLVISGFYQFSPLKKKCLGYCESPLAFFMKRWKGNKLRNGLTMGLYHGVYCLGCCWPYFLLMIALGWMNLLWMGLFAAIIFVEKTWSKGIWMARGVGIMFILIGLLTITGMISVVTEGNEMASTNTDMTSMNMNMNNPAQGSETKDIKHNMNMNMK